VAAPPVHRSQPHLMCFQVMPAKFVFKISNGVAMMIGGNGIFPIRKPRGYRTGL